MKLLLLIVLSACLTSIGMGDPVTYDYTGASLNSSVSGTGNPLVPTSISGTLVLASVLNPNEVNQVVTPESFSFTGQDGYLSSAAQNAYANHTSDEQVTSSFSFTTVNGNVVGWDIILSAMTPGTNNGITVNESLVNSNVMVNGLSPAVGDSYYASSMPPGCGSGYGADNCYSVSAQNSTPGMTIDPPNLVAAPEMAGSGLVNGLIFLCCATFIAMGKQVRI